MVENTLKYSIWDKKNWDTKSDFKIIWEKLFTQSLPMFFTSYSKRSGKKTNSPKTYRIQKTNWNKFWIKQLQLGTFKILKNDLKNGITIFEENIISSKLGRKTWHEALMYRFLGWSYLVYGNLTLAKYFFELSSMIFDFYPDKKIASIESLKSQFFIIRCNIIQGNLAKASDLAEELLLKSKNGASYNFEAFLFIEMGNIYFQMGEFEVAYLYYEKSYNFFDSLENIDEKITLGLKMGKIFIARNDIDQALKVFDKFMNGLTNSSYLTNIYDFIIFFADSGYLSQALDLYYRRIRKIKFKLLVNQLDLLDQFDLIEAELLKKSNQLKDKVKAIQILEQLVNSSYLPFEKQVLALYNLCELHIIEAKISDNNFEAIQKIEVINNKIFNLGKKYSLYSHIIYSKLISTQLSVLRGDLNKSYTFLNEALEISRDNGLNKLEERIEIEKEQLITIVKDRRKLAPFERKIKDLELQRYISEALFDYHSEMSM
ncbi:MAG: hypothetical protein HeimC3_24890 [Candidatus Heimdallarchaeota archaeon LC_3]|nr:MAG: hypothetical protein HeimC3_24890 [Candidatus Heimdallarchaeota archaeon LC_3]